MERGEATRLTTHLVRANMFALVMRWKHPCIAAVTVSHAWRAIGLTGGTGDDNRPCFQKTLNLRSVAVIDGALVVKRVQLTSHGEGSTPNSQERGGQRGR